MQTCLPPCPPLDRLSKTSLISHLLQSMKINAGFWTDWEVRHASQHSWPQLLTPPGVHQGEGWWRAPRWVVFSCLVSTHFSRVQGRIHPFGWNRGANGEAPRRVHSRAGMCAVPLLQAPIPPSGGMTRVSGCPVSGLCWHGRVKLTVTGVRDLRRPP